MTDALASAENLQWTLLQTTWQSLLLALIVGTVCGAAGRHISASWRFVLWGLVFVRLACPVMPASAFSAHNLLPDPLAVLKGARETNPSAVPNETAPFPSSLSSLRFPSPQDATGRRVQAVRSPLTQPMAIANPWSGLIFVIWAVGAGTLLLHNVRLWVRLHRTASGWQNVSDPEYRRLFTECYRERGIRRPVAWLVADEPIGPATFGLLHPRIVVPSSLLRSLNLEQLRMLLLHELSHIRRNDVLWDRLAGILVALHWFNPAAWWARTRLRDEREQACDGEVMRLAGARHRFFSLDTSVSERGNRRAVVREQDTVVLRRPT